MSVDTAELPTKVSTQAGGSMTRMLTVQEVATVLNCSARTVYRLADSGRMPPPFRLGGLVRWSPAVFEAWISHGCPACCKTVPR